jgi:hypothetical protein
MAFIKIICGQIETELSGINGISSYQNKDAIRNVKTVLTVL